MENAYWGVMARAVEAAYSERLRFVNRRNVTYVRNAVRVTPALYNTEDDLDRLVRALRQIAANGV